MELSSWLPTCPVIVRSSTTPVPAWRFPSQKYSRSIYWSSSHTRWKRNTHTNNHRHRHTHTYTHRNKDDWNHQIFGCFSDSSAKIHMGPAISIPETGGTANQPGEIWKSMPVNATHSTPETTRAHTHTYINLCVYNYIDYKQYSMAHTTGRICRLLLLSPLGWPIELPCNLQSRSIPVADSSDLFWARL